MSIEEQLYEIKEKFDALVKTCPFAVTISNLEGKITDVSEQTLKLHGFDSEGELKGKSAFELIDPSDHQKAMENLQKTIKEGSVKNLEYTLKRKDGSTFIGELNAAVLRDASGNPRFFIATTQDITYLKSLEKALEEKEALLKIQEISGKQ
ncbi:PAS domain-containing protein [Candidatus Margulisiibacteriota bacterium]